MSKSKPPLFDFFIFMEEEAGLSLTIDQYHMLLQALQGGFGISSRSDLKQVCRLLWIKSSSSPQVERFEQCFEQYFEQYFQENSQNLAQNLAQNLEPQFQKKNSKGSKKATSTDKTPITSPPSSSTTPVAPTTTPDSKSVNYPQIPTAMRGELLPEQPFREGRYQLTPRDFPITQRQIQQNWRYLRRPIREGGLTEIDIEATVEQIIQEGVFLQPVLIPSHVNRVEMLLLIDDSNSMIPFRLLSQKIVATLQASRLGKADTYYFRNFPRDYLYLHPRHPDATKINELLPKLHCNRTVILIISDAGAARGGINRDRIKLTEEFVEQSTPYVRHFAWLNPIPSQRWQYTSAEAISQLVPMFELNHQGFKAAMRSLKL
ncbi:MAG: hypothetical protein AAF208_03905 [Cyanobacteria bacterium P01_A01_bin.45]